MSTKLLLHTKHGVPKLIFQERERESFLTSHLYVLYRACRPRTSMVTLQPATCTPTEEDRFYTDKCQIHLSYAWLKPLDVGLRNKIKIKYNGTSRKLFQANTWFKIIYQPTPSIIRVRFMSICVRQNRPIIVFSSATLLGHYRQSFFHDGGGFL